MPDGTNFNAGDSPLAALQPALRRLDRLLERALVAADAAYGPQASGDPYRGLHISHDDAERLLAREPGFPTLWGEGEASSPAEATKGSPLPRLAAHYSLSSFDLDAILIALAPELDLRYERLYAYLQDDVSRRRPSVNLVLDLLCGCAAEKLERRRRFVPDAPLLRHGLLELIANPQQPRQSLLAHDLKLDEQVVAYLIGQRSLDPRLALFCEEIEPAVDLEQLPVADELRRALRHLAQAARLRPLRLYFRGSPGAGKGRAAEALAGEAGTSLLAVDLERVVIRGEDLEQALERISRHRLLRPVALHLEGIDVLGSEERAGNRRRLLGALAEWDGLTVLSGVGRWQPGGGEPTGVLEVDFPPLGFARRRDCWQAELAAVGLELDSADVEALAGRFRLTPAQIAEAAASAGTGVLLDDPGSQSSVRDALFTAARTQSGHGLAALAHKIEPVYTWDDIVLPDDAAEQLREICRRVVHRERVLGDWGFDRRLSHGKGVNALFAGASGTGKTMAAEIVAGELGLDLYRIDLSGVVSKYIGETEKNLDRVFRAAEDSNAILLFDEADALFGKRSEVRDSHDRYANIEISYLLQKMEQYEGLAILATNLRAHLDDAFVRRLAFTVQFPLPDEVSRRRIWAGIWPAETPIGDDVDLDLLARRFRLTGGNIKNIALAASFLAAADGGRVAMPHLVQATRREYQKLGKVMSEAELGGSL